MRFQFLAAVCCCMTFSTIAEPQEEKRLHGASTETSAVKIVEIKSKTCSFKFDVINDVSELPLCYMRTCENKTSLKKVELPAYWLSAAPITRKQFADVMGISIDEIMDCALTAKEEQDAPIDSVDWLTAYEFCSRFNERYSAQLPKGYLLQLPTMVEWAHAIRILEKKAKIVSPVGCMLFTGDGRGGILAYIQ